MYRVQMTSWEVRVAGSSFSRLLDRSRVCRWRRPQGNTEGKATKQLEDRSRWTIREDKSMNQSSSNQASCRSLQQTLTVCRHKREQLLLLDPYHKHIHVLVVHWPVLRPRWTSPESGVWASVCWRLDGPWACRRRILLHSAAGTGQRPHYLQRKTHPSQTCVSIHLHLKMWKKSLWLQQYRAYYSDIHRQKR